MYRRILVATDGTKLSGTAARHGIDLAAAAGADLVALNVSERYPVAFFEKGFTVSGDEVDRFDAESASRGRALVDKLCGAALARGVKATPVVVRSNHVAESILAAAKKHKCDLIVMASHGRKGLKRVLMGSETQQVLVHGTVPVLVVR
ncbi:universal stress protein [Ramlibacter sp. WS9]|uniref:universal stress protein n=1 Tax=Ramlibacter sp. WS9 TaxID=1882741 RepID=UPI001143973B|nr:universal stress protein [Ramlibacter sp. WS9]ROZ75408.1 universal stress protein [Ramlibacter sp. WS9]